MNIVRMKNVVLKYVSKNVVKKPLAAFVRHDCSPALKQRDLYIVEDICVSDAYQSVHHCIHHHISEGTRMQFLHDALTVRDSRSDADTQSVSHLFVS